MGKRLFAFALTIVVFISFSTSTAFAIVDPLSTPNNIFGIHILFPSELSQAANLVNSNGGKWGYVVIPVQAGDKDIKKWQKFMDDAGKLNIIPIIRLATEGDYFNTKVWRRPNYADIVDFANFLDSLSWTTKNRYIVIFNEVNRADEWGGKSDPTQYADLLNYAVSVFKSKNQDFFIIPAGLDNAAATTSDSYNEYEFLQKMNVAVPGIFNQIDGIASHSYPNPGFAQPPQVITSESIGSFQFEKNWIESTTGKQFPVFITETGWPIDVVPETNIPFYYKTAFANAWSNKNIVTVAPFLLQGNGGPFAPFSFLRMDGSLSAAYKTIYDMPKITGNPILPPIVLAEEALPNVTTVADFSRDKLKSPTIANIPQSAVAILKWFLRL